MDYHHGGRYRRRGVVRRECRGRDGRGGGDDDDAENREKWEEGRGRIHRRGGRGGRPPGLRGKEIGLYYARMGKARNAIKEKTQRPVVAMDCRKETEITKLLSSIRQLPSSRSSAVDWFDGDDSAGPSGGDSTRQPPLHGSDSSRADGCDSIRRPAQSASASSATECFGSDGPFRSHCVSRESSPDLSSLDDYHRHYTEKLSHIEDSAFKKHYMSNLLGNKSHSVDDLRYDPSVDGIKRNVVLDEQLLKKFSDKVNSAKYCKMLEFRKKLPSFAMKEKIIDTINSNQAVVLSGETGCGKTTQVPQFVLDSFLSAGRGSLCRIICTQPRRISAISVAERVAEERAEACGSGNSVGFQIRVENKLPASCGSILYCTTGILIKFLESDPLLTSTSHVILDEIHERDILSDFLLTILKDILPVRKDLKLILMSATINAAQFTQYYNDCPVLNIPGFTFPVQQFYLEDVLKLTGFTFDEKQRKEKPWAYGRNSKTKKEYQKEEEYRNLIGPYLRKLRAVGFSRSVVDSLSSPQCEELNTDLIVETLRFICSGGEDGAILVFLPGWEQISNLNKALSQDRFFSNSKFLILPLHSMMPTVNQREVFDRSPPGKRKIVIATNIAETSITIDDVVFVIDCGKIKLKRYDVETNLSTLQPEWVSLANAKQRRGRAGRVQPGKCYHLYSRAREETLDKFLLPEILRTRLEELCLQVKILRLGNIATFLSKCLDRPLDAALHSSLRLLRTLNALDEEENLTPLGFHLARLPMDPQTGKMILMAAIFSCVDPVLTVAASLSFKDAFVIPLGKEKEVDRIRLRLADGSCSDHLMLLNAYNGWEDTLRHQGSSAARSYCWDHFLSPNTLNLLRDMKRQFMRHLHDMKFVSSDDTREGEANINARNLSLVRAVVCAGLYPNIAKVLVKRRRNGGKAVRICTPEDGRVKLHPKSVNCSEQNFGNSDQAFTTYWLVYREKMKSSGVLLHDSSLVYPYSLLFFGQGVRLLKDEGGETIAVDDHIMFKCSEKTASLVKELRKELDKLLEYKISHPGCTSWNSKEGAVLSAIIELVTQDAGLGECGGGQRWEADFDD